jgi:hypothetical protein
MGTAPLLFSRRGRGWFSRKFNDFRKETELMSRSFQKTPITGVTTCESEKQDKREANRKLRRKTKLQVKAGSEMILALREVSDVWSMGKDGKSYRENASQKELRK